MLMHYCIGSKVISNITCDGSWSCYMILLKLAVMMNDITSEYVEDAVKKELIVKTNGPWCSSCAYYRKILYNLVWTTEELIVWTLKTYLLHLFMQNMSVTENCTSARFTCSDTESTLEINRFRQTRPFFHLTWLLNWTHLQARVAKSL